MNSTPGGRHRSKVLANRPLPSRRGKAWRMSDRVARSTFRVSEKYYVCGISRTWASHRDHCTRQRSLASSIVPCQMRVDGWRGGLGSRSAPTWSMLADRGSRASMGDGSPTWTLPYLSNKHIVAYMLERSLAVLEDPLQVSTTGYLDCTLVLISDKGPRSFQKRRLLLLVQGVRGSSRLNTRTSE